MLVTQATRIQTIGPELFDAILPETSREGIRWSGGIGGRPLEVAIDFRNPGPTFSEPASARIDIAPFGAFVPGELLATAAVPSLPPGGVWTFRTAVASGDLPAWTRTPRVRPSVPTRSARPSRSSRRPASFWSRLWSDDSLPLVEGVHFVGNLNIFVTARQPVERHMTRAVKLRAGAANLGRFVVGNGKPADYTFHPAVCEPGWRMDLHPYGWDKMVNIRHGAATLVIVPPPKAESGKAAVRVERVGSWRKSSTLVEFELEVGASGSKCYSF